MRGQDEWHRSLASSDLLQKRKVVDPAGFQLKSEERREFLQSCLQQVYIIQSDYPSFKIVIVGDGGTDRSQIYELLIPLASDYEFKFS
ncbi:hypothetical protein L2E82_29447 [Cichorium intybus]|uniref:Uncharacterized protein n=2 Tax=Cichorium intybus TaxID=13427 RepID=A0ACB9CWZ7_CICIN|nr:hypothetical protein L2E82_28841 [Cichorium intybus]KAI3739069.1 hypothetical protein L2E82_29447 [Cichorium intybus]